MCVCASGSLRSGRILFRAWNCSIARLHFPYFRSPHVYQEWCGGGGGGAQFSDSAWNLVPLIFGGTTGRKFAASQCGRSANFQIFSACIYVYKDMMDWLPRCC